MPGRLYLNLQPQTLTISEDLRWTYAFDREGRLLSAFVDGTTYWRGLSGKVLEKSVPAPGQKRRRLLGPEEAGEMLRRALDHVARLGPHLPPDPREDLRPWLDAILSWDDRRLAAERAAFEATYRPVSILPPDQYLALVVQATLGCSWNRCSFCDLYRDRSFQIRSADAFRRHVREVKALVGRGIGLRKGLFLGDANALIIPQPRLRELIAVLHAELPIGPGGLRGVYAFLDIFGAEQKSEPQYEELRELGLRRIYIGLESGDEGVFQLLNKPGSPQACVEAVRSIKAAGINVGVILLAGAGGRQLAAGHVARSLAALAAMQPGPGDTVYVSPLIVPDDGPYAARARAMGLTPLAPVELEAQLTELKAGARRVVGPGPRVALYHVEEFIY